MRRGCGQPPDRRARRLGLHADLEANFFHHSKAQGPNFTSVRNSVVINQPSSPCRQNMGRVLAGDGTIPNSAPRTIWSRIIFSSPRPRTDRPSGVTNSSTGNQFKNNVVGRGQHQRAPRSSANAGGQLLATDATYRNRQHLRNITPGISGYLRLGRRGPIPTLPMRPSCVQPNFDPAWFAAFPTTSGHDAAAFAPTADRDRG